VLLVLARRPLPPPPLKCDMPLLLRKHRDEDDCRDCCCTGKGF
jgi:hypothetical protein